MTTEVYGDFEWDAAKAVANLTKHGVSFVEASTVLGSEGSVDLPDAAHPDRVTTIGFSSAARALLVVSTEGAGDRIRIISARRATRAERRYLEG